jgi:hypothetical protein
VLESQNPLPRTTVLKVQERSTMKLIHQYRKLAAASVQGEESTNVLRIATREVMAHTPTDESRYRMFKLHAEYDPDSVSTIPRYTAATGNKLQNQALLTDMGLEKAVMH